MGSLESRVGVLEAARMSTERQLVREALTYLSDGDLDALEDVLVAREENPSASSEDLYRLVGERGRRAVVALNDVHEDLKEGREPQNRRE